MAKTFNKERVVAKGKGGNFKGHMISIEFLVKNGVTTSLSSISLSSKYKRTTTIKGTRGRYSIFLGSRATDQH